MKQEPKFKKGDLVRIISDAKSCSGVFGLKATVERFIKEQELYLVSVHDRVSNRWHFKEDGIERWYKFSLKDKNEIILI